MGAPLEVATLLEEIGRERSSSAASCDGGEIGADPELDEFMVHELSILQFFFLFFFLYRILL